MRSLDAMLFHPQRELEADAFRPNVEAKAVSLSGFELSIQHAGRLLASHACCRWYGELSKRDVPSHTVSARW